MERHHLPPRQYIVPPQAAAGAAGAVRQAGGREPRPHPAVPAGARGLGGTFMERVTVTKQYNKTD